MVEESNHVVFSYSRAEAIEDGVLVDVSEAATPFGFRHPVAVTHRLWEECVAPPEPIKGHGQDEPSRLRDVLFLASIAARLEGRERTSVPFGIRVLVEPNHYELKRVYLHCGPGDEAEPVFTILMEGED